MRERSIRSYAQTARRACLRFLRAALLLIAFAPHPSDAAPVDHAQALAILHPPSGRLLAGIYPGGGTGEEDDITPADVDAVTRILRGWRPDWITFSNNWYRSRAFPRDTAEWIRGRGAIPYIRLMLRSDPEEDHAEPLFTLTAIASGRFDADLKAWARQAARFGTPLLVEYGTEMNGRWFPWNAVWNGRETGARKFRDAYRHIIDVMRKQGASNIIWIFHVDDEDDPQAAWNRFEAYYPGNRWIDVVGVSIYSMLGPYETERTDFVRALDAAAARLRRLAPGRPMIVSEFGTDVHNRREPAARWANRALKAMHARRWRDLVGFAWWNERWENDDNPAHDTDMRIQASPALAEVFRHYLRPRLREMPHGDRAR